MDERQRETGFSKVQDTSLTTTILQGLDGGLVSTPNSSITTSKVIKHSRAGLFEVSIPLTVTVGVDLARVGEIAHDHPLILSHVAPAGRSAIQGLFDLPRPYIALFESKMHVTSIKEAWVRLAIRIWIRQIPGRDVIVSEYPGSIIDRPIAEELLAPKRPEEESAPETLPCPIQKDNIQKDVEL